VYKYFIAFRYLRSRFITWLAIAGVTIGVMALVIVTSVMGGFESELHERIRGTMGHITIESDSFFGVHNPGAIENAVMAVPHVTGTSPYVESIALFSGLTLDWGKIKGIEPVKEMVVGNFNKYLLTDEEAEALGKIEFLKARVEDYKSRREQFAWVVDTLMNRGIERQRLIELLKEAGVIYSAEFEMAFRGEDKEKILDEKKKNLRKWVEKAGILETDEEIFDAYRYGALTYGIEKYEARIKELETLKESMSGRPPFNEDEVADIFKGNRLRPKSILLTDGKTVSGAITSENETHLILKIPAEKDPYLKSEIGFRDDAYSLDEISEIREVAPLIVGVQWYRHYNVRVHDLITIITVRPDNLNRTSSKEFEVMGVFKTGMYETDFRYVYTDLKSMQTFMNLDSDVSGISVRLDDYRRSDECKGPVTAALKDPSLRVQTWEDKQKTLLSAVKMEKWLLSFILFFMIIIAGFMNLCILTMMVVEKTKDLGIIKAVGGTTSGVFSIFLFTGGFIGILGTLLGCVFGGLFVIFINDISAFVEMLTGVNPFPKNVYYLDKIPTAFMPMELVFIIVPAVAISFLFALYPAFRAAQMDPIEAFRHE
jgi:ABC-type lipoprotein release transport system permease subunit